MWNQFAWNFLNNVKRETVLHLPEEQWLDVKLACDELFHEASHNYSICPAWYIG